MINLISEYSLIARDPVLPLVISAVKIIHSVQINIDFLINNDGYAPLQAICCIVDPTRWEFCKSLLKANILNALVTIRSTTTMLQLCCIATQVVALLGSWKHVQLLENGMEHLRPYSADIAGFLLGSLPQSACSISTDLRNTKGTTWKQGFTPFESLDGSMSEAVDTLNTLYTLCIPDIQHEVLKAVFQIIKVGALSQTFESLHAAIRFLARHFCIHGIDQQPGKPMPACPCMPSQEATQGVMDACLQMTWSSTAGLQTHGTKIYNSLLRNNCSLWTSTILSQILQTCLEQGALGWPAAVDTEANACELFIRNHYWIHGMFQSEELNGLMELLCFVIEAHPSKPWEKAGKDWSAGNECKELELMVMLEALKAGALQFSMRIYVSGHTGIMQHLSGSTPRGLLSLTRLRESGSWPIVMHHLVQAARQLTEIALQQHSQPTAEVCVETKNENKDDKEQTEQPSLSCERMSYVQDHQSPWTKYTFQDACKFLAEVSALHQCELLGLESGAFSTALPKDGQQTSSEQAMLQTLHSTLKKAVAQVALIMEDGKLSSALLAAPLISALLGGHMLTPIPLSFNADLLFNTGIITKVSVHLNPLTAAGNEESLKQIMGVLLMLASRNTEAHGRLIQVSNLSVMLKIAGNSIEKSVDILKFVCSVASSQQARGMMRDVGVPDAMSAICEVSTCVEIFLGFLGFRVLLWF